MKSKEKQREETMGEQENTRHDLLAGPAFELGEEPGEGLAEHSSAIRTGNEEPGGAGAGEGEAEHSSAIRTGNDAGEEPGTRHPVGVIYGRRVVLAWNISEGMDIFVQGKLISSEWDPNPKWFIAVWNEGRLVMNGTVFSRKQWVVKIAQKLRNAATCKARSLRVKRAAKRQRLAEGLAERSSAIKSGSEEPGNTAGSEGAAGTTGTFRTPQAALDVVIANPPLSVGGAETEATAL
jgi:hypothetical protein